MKSGASQRRIEWMISRWVEGVMRHPAPALLIVLMFTLIAGWLAARDLGINTRSSDMIDPQEIYRVEGARLKRLFPLVTDQILVIVRGRTADETDAAARWLARRLERHKEVFDDLFAAGVDPFLEQEGLLLVDRDKLYDLTSRLSSGAPLLEDLIAAPRLSVFFDDLAKAGLAEEHGVSLDIVADLFSEVADTIDAVTNGRPRPLSWQRLFGRDEAIHQQLITLHPRLDFHSLQPARLAVQAIHASVAEMPADLRKAVAIHLTGEPVLRSEELHSVSQGIEVSAGLSLLLVAFLLALALRSWQGCMASLVALAVSLVLTAGFAALAVGSLNLISIAFTVLMIGLGIDFAIHLLLHYREELRRDHSRHEAMRHAARGIARGLTLAAVTTAVAFYSFAPTRFIGMAQLGVISGTGIIIAFMVTLTVIPAIIRLLPAVRRPAPHWHGGMRLVLALEKASPVTLALSLLLGLAALSAVPQVRFDADPMHLRDPDAPSVKAFALLFDRPRDNPYRLHYIAPDRAQADRFAERARALPEVRDVTTISRFLPIDQDERMDEIDFLAGDLWFVGEASPDALRAAAASPVDRQATTSAMEKLAKSARSMAGQGNEPRHQAAARLAASIDAFLALEKEKGSDEAGRQRLFEGLRDAVFRFFPDVVARLKRQLQPLPLTLERLPTRIRDRYLAPSGEARAEVLPSRDLRDAENRRRFVDAVRAIEPRLTGSAYAVLRAAQVVAQSMMQATVAAFLLAVLLVALVLRQLASVVLVMVPLLFAGLLTVAAGVIFDIPFNFANVIVLPLLIGMGIDAAIHLVAQSRDLDHAESVFRTSTPRAILFSALTTMASFGTLVLSHHRGTASMGKLLLLALSLTLVSTLLVLPAMLEIRRRWLVGRRKGKAMKD
ncbi:MAG: hypothetical protein D6757_04520 [Alphaproteobacteria bacterium]|nr:MAG: hypothetical protein D6757_04520 [Alphaproteobacteria bacterium]